jgi:hypothetical protein
MSARKPPGESYFAKRAADRLAIDHLRVRMLEMINGGVTQGAAARQLGVRGYTLKVWMRAIRARRLEVPPEIFNAIPERDFRFIPRAGQERCLALYASGGSLDAVKRQHAAELAGNFVSSPSAFRAGFTSA